MHTNLDKAIGGVSYRMAQKIGLADLRILSVDHSIQSSTAGLGCVGRLDTPEDEKQFLLRLKQIFDIKAIRHSHLLNRKIQTVALCGGSGAEFIDDAISQGADIYLTADIKYHEYFRPDNQIVIADIGHFESEHFTKEIIYEQLIKFFPNFACNMSNADINPVEYT